MFFDPAAFRPSGRGHGAWRQDCQMQRRKACCDDGDRPERKVCGRSLCQGKQDQAYRQSTCKRDFRPDLTGRDCRLLFGSSGGRGSAGGTGHQDKLSAAFRGNRTEESWYCGSDKGAGRKERPYLISVSKDLQCWDRMQKRSRKGKDRGGYLSGF